ncbi:phage tail protein [Streptosporangium sp. OZ121]|uniref:phage tail protein n=1 Tax=Streptosporangium sp. OZ121 TaxID=3444183 RepID=UPI003F78F7D5
MHPELHKAFGKNLKKQLEAELKPVGETVGKDLGKNLGSSLSDSFSDAFSQKLAAHATLVAGQTEAAITEHFGRASISVDSLADTIRDFETRLRESFDGAGRDTEGLGDSFEKTETRGRGHLGRLVDTVQGLGAAALAVGSKVATMAGAVGNAAGSVLSATASFGGFALKATAVAGALSAVGAAGAVSVQGVLLLTAALAPASGIFLALPGMLGMVVAAFTVFKLATSEVGDAMKASLEGNVEKYEKILGTLALNARAVAVEFNDVVVPALKNLKASLGEAFFHHLIGEFEAVTLAVRTQVSPALLQVAHDLGAAAKEVTGFVSSASGSASIASVFHQTSDAIEDLVPAIKPLLQGFADIARAGAVFTTTLTPGLAQATIRFGEFLSKSMQTGQAVQWMKDAVAVIKQLGSILGDLGGIVKAVFAALKTAGGDTLGVVGDLISRVRDFLESGKGQSILVTIFESLARVGAALMPVIVALAGAIQLLAPEIAAIAEAVGPILAAAVKAVAPAIASLSVGILAILEGLRPVVPIAAEFAGILAGVLVQAVTILSPMLPVVASALLAILSAVAPLVPVLAQVAATLLNELAKALQLVAPYLPELVKAFGDLLIALLPLVGPILEVVTALLPLIPVATDIIRLLTELANLVMPLLVGAVELVAASIAHFVGDVKKKWDEFYADSKRLIDLVVEEFDGFAELPGKFAEWFGEAKDTALARLSEFSSWIQGLPGRIIGFLSSLGSTLAAMGRDWIIGLHNGAISAWNGFISWVSGIPGAIARSIGDFGNHLRTAGWNMMIGFWNGVIDAWNGFINWWNNAVNGIMDIARRILEINSPSRAFIRIGKSVGEGLSMGVKATQGLVMSAVESLAGSAMDAWGAVDLPLAFAATGAPTGVLNTPVTPSAGNWSAGHEPAGQSASKVYNVTLNAAPDVPSEKQLVNALKYSDALYA